MFGGADSSWRNDAWVLTHANGLGGEPAWIPLKPAGTPPEAHARATAGLARAPFDRMLVALGQGADLWLLSNPASGAAPEAGSIVARGTIRNDDPLPVVSIEDAPVVTEGDSGARDAVFTVSLSVPSAETVTVAYKTRDDDAVGGLDYVSVDGILSIPPGTPSVSLHVPVKGDPFPEADEAFVVDLLHAIGATIGNAEGRAVIVDDDAAVNPVPYVSDIAPLAVLPGSPGFDLTVHGANFLPVSVVRWNGASRPTTYVSARELRAAISADDVATPRTGLVTVQTPGPGGGVSEAMPLLVTTPSTLLSFTRSDIAAGDGPGFLGTGDFNGDGKADLAVANTQGERSRSGSGTATGRSRRAPTTRPCTRPTPWRWRTSTGTGGPTWPCFTTTARGRSPSSSRTRTARSGAPRFPDRGRGHLVQRSRGGRLQPGRARRRGPLRSGPRRGPSPPRLR